MIYFIIILFTAALIALLARYNIWRMPISYKNARVLMYHSISSHYGEKMDKWRVRPGDFEKQIKWLHNHGFTSYKMSEFLALDKTPPKAVIITFDDGFGDNFEACEVLKKYNFKATIYLVAGATQNSWEAANTANLAPMLTDEQIKKLQNSGTVEFGSHTLGHFNLLKLNEAELKEELIRSKAAVEGLTGVPCEAFAYPYGKHSPQIIAAVKEAGYKSAVVVKRGVFTSATDPFEIPRIGVLGGESFFDFWLKISRVRNKL